MKTQQEQMEFASKQKELTDNLNNLIKQFAEAVDKQPILLDIKSTIEQIDKFRKSFMD